MHGPERAFMRGHTTLFRMYRNRVNRAMEGTPEELLPREGEGFGKMSTNPVVERYQGPGWQDAVRLQLAGDGK